MKVLKFILLGLFFSGIYQCTPSKVVSINSELMVISATKTKQLVKGIPGIKLDFTVISTKPITLDSVYYWENKHPLIIVKTNNDTIWAKAEMRFPNFAKEMRDESIDMSTIRPPDSTCILIYHLDQTSLKLEVPELKLLQ